MTLPISQIPSFSVPSMPASMDDTSSISMPMALEQAIQIQPHAGNAIGEAEQSAFNSQMMSLKDSQALNPLNGAKTHTDAQLKKVSQNFESIFINMLLTEMRKSVEKSNLFGNSQAEQFFDSLRDQAISEQLSKAGGIGLGNIIYQQLKKATESHIKAYS